MEFRNAEAAALRKAPIMDSKMDVDMGVKPESHHLNPLTEPASIPTLDGWIESLMNCKQLAESDVQKLCDRVCVLCWLCGLREAVFVGCDSGLTGVYGP